MNTAAVQRELNATKYNLYCEYSKSFEVKNNPMAKEQRYQSSDLQFWFVARVKTSLHFSIFLWCDKGFPEKKIKYLTADIFLVF